MDELCELTSEPFPYKITVTSNTNHIQHILVCPHLLILVTGCIRLRSYELCIYHGVLTNTVESVIAKLESSFIAVNECIEESECQGSVEGGEAIPQ